MRECQTGHAKGRRKKKDVMASKEPCVEQSDLFEPQQATVTVKMHVQEAQPPAVELEEHGPRSHDRTNNRL